MQIRLEVLSQETINYRDKKTGEAKAFDVLNCREASPASVLLPVRLSARDFAGVKIGSTIEVRVSELTRGKLDTAVSVRGSLVNGK